MNRLQESSSGRSKHAVPRRVISPAIRDISRPAMSSECAQRWPGPLLSAAGATWRSTKLSAWSAPAPVPTTTTSWHCAAPSSPVERRLKDADHPELFSGLIWTGEQAKQLGLIDKLGDVDYVARDLVGATSQVDFTVKDNAFDRFAKRLGASAAQQLSMALGFSGVSLR